MNRSSFVFLCAVAAAGCGGSPSTGDAAPSTADLATAPDADRGAHRVVR